ncbi:dihydrolipoamide acetyltransferase family protein [Candidatus Palauibacter sp.]|uniref:dihydrolipoamide acetyltransferase family protein n=1 Tax=Candidatus Palauibacter sp. TaxID=3101350 RepID=UPI003D125305
MSKVDVIMPQMGESIAEGTLTRWLKNVGDAVERDEDLFEISTDKVDADIPSPAAGVLAEVLVQSGETVEVDTVVARIETDATAATAAALSAPAAEPPLDPPAEAPAAEPVTSTAAAAIPAAPPADTLPTSPGPGAAGPPASRDERLRTRSTPLVRKIAAEHGVDIHQVPGTGASGRVTRDDILAFISAGGPEVAPAPAAAPAPTAAPAAVPAPIPASEVKASEPTLPETSAPEPAAPGTLRIPIHGATLDVRLGSVPIRERDRVEEMSRVRLRTMEHMLMSKRVSAHVTSVIEVDFERIVQLRRALKPRFADQGVKLTYGPFIYRAVIEALGEYPILNSSVDGSRIVYHGNINLGIAVAINDGRELIVPVLRDADQLSLLGLAQRSNELAEKARNKALDFDDIQGGTFTITNVGVFGNLFGTPIINQPQVAILGTGVIEKRPVVVQDGLGNDVIAIRNRAYFGLSYDHRVVDGAMAAFFLNRVQEYLEGFPDDSA